MSKIIGGVPVAGFISPTDSNDDYFVTTEEYNRGGYRSVLTTQELNDIPIGRCKAGMLVNVIEENKIFMLKNNIWEELNFSSKMIKTLVFNIQGELVNGEYPVYLNSPISGTISDITGIVTSPCDFILRINIQKISYNDYSSGKENWVNITSSPVYIEGGKRFINSNWSLAHPMVNTNDIFRISIVSSSSENLTLNLKIIES